MEQNYLDLLKDVLDNGYETSDRTGTGTTSVFGRQLRFDLRKGFPLITTKKVFWKGVVVELLWLLRGETNIKFLKDYGVSIWDEWADERGDLGRVYGKQWRKWESFTDGPVGSDYVCIDQISNVIQRIKDKPDCRRLIVSAWNAAEIDLMKLPPCHSFFQFKVYGNVLNLQLYQRSADLFLGVPFNIASYSLLLTLVANECDLQPGEFIHTFGDAHIYNNHINQVKEQLARQAFDPPSVDVFIEKGDLLKFVDRCHAYPWKADDLNKIGISDLIKINNYLSHAPIKAEVSV